MFGTINSTSTINSMAHHLQQGLVNRWKRPIAVQYCVMLAARPLHDNEHRLATTPNGRKINEIVLKFNSLSPVSWLTKTHGDCENRFEKTGSFLTITNNGPTCVCSYSTPHHSVCTFCYPTNPYFADESMTNKRVTAFILFFLPFRYTFFTRP